RMSGAMQAGIQIAEQGAGNSQQSSQNGGRLHLVVRPPHPLVGVRFFTRKARGGTNLEPGAGRLSSMDLSMNWGGQDMRGAPARGMMPSGMMPSGMMPLGAGRQGPPPGMPYGQAAPYAANGASGYNGVGSYGNGSYGN